MRKHKIEQKNKSCQSPERQFHAVIQSQEKEQECYSAVETLRVQNGWLPLLSVVSESLVTNEDLISRKDRLITVRSNASSTERSSQKDCPSLGRDKALIGRTGEEGFGRKHCSDRQSECEACVDVCPKHHEQPQ